MLTSKIAIGLLLSILILILVAENEVEAAPEPCGELFRMYRQKQPKDDVKDKEEEEKKRKEKKRKEKLKRIEKFFEDLLPWGPSWRTHEDEKTDPLDATVANYVKFFSNLFTYV